MRERQLGVKEVGARGGERESSKYSSTRSIRLVDITIIILYWDLVLSSSCITIMIHSNMFKSNELGIFSSSYLLFDLYIVDG